jgi:hypothetical protein
MLITNQPDTYYSSTEAAQALVTDMIERAGGDTDGWEYRVVPAGKYARIAVYDEDGEFVGHL